MSRKSNNQPIETKNYLKLVKNCIKTVVNQFFYRPDNFFSEEEFKEYLFAVFYRQKEFAKTFATTDGKRTMLVHPEYPSASRIPLETTKGFRRWYDVAILNPEFIESNDYRTVANRTENDSSNAGKNVIAAVEFKFLNKEANPRACVLMNNDVEKLNQADEVIGKYCLVFSNCQQKNKEWLENYKPKDTKILYEEVWQEKGKKKRYIFMNPKNWLKI